jgi:hypothetical protein
MELTIEEVESELRLDRMFKRKTNALLIKVLHTLRNVEGCYIIILNGGCEYIGKSEDLGSRTISSILRCYHWRRIRSEHRGDWEVKFAFTESDNSALEGFLIRTMKPNRNIRREFTEESPCHWINGPYTVFEKAPTSPAS